MKKNVVLLSNLITKLITNIENEFEELVLSDQKNKIKLQKVIAETLAKLVELVIKLHRLAKEEGEDNINISSEDLKIIENFLQSHINNMGDD